jgi:opacity protein-like surface antigen
MKKLLIMTAAVVAFATSAFANDLVTRFPWLAKAQWDLTKSECYAAMRHDSSTGGAEANVTCEKFDMPPA